MALVNHVFGKTISFRYFPLAGDEDMTLHSLSSARLYADEPSDAQRANTASGHLQEVTSWTLTNPEGSGPAYYLITFAALEDPDVNSSEEYELYFVALNFKAESTGPVVQDDEQLQIWRIDGLTSKIDVTAQDVIEIESRLEPYLGQLAIEAKIDLAIEDVLSRLEGRGYAKRRLVNLYKLRLAVKMLACAFCCFDLAGEGNQFWADKGERWLEMSEEHFNIAKVGLDAVGDDRPDPESVVQTGGVVAIIR